ncbi:MAG: cell division topological specificity factor MinE, partial [Candidatus Gastranaerophilales bacterium]|nr:cell division topological specificity factor MinE [Candidatus Gastranaerophilales bacterium]
MKDLFQELYNKVLSLFNSTKEENDPTKNLAVNRLKTVLMQDRAGFSERAIQMLKEELTQVVSKYMEISAEDFEMLIDTNDEGKTLLNLSILVSRAKTDEEIDEWVKEQELKIQKKAQEIAKELEGTIKEKAKTLINDEENSNENIKTEGESEIV